MTPTHKNLINTPFLFQIWRPTRHPTTCTAPIVAIIAIAVDTTPVLGIRTFKVANNPVLVNGWEGFILLTISLSLSQVTQILKPYQKPS